MTRVRWLGKNINNITLLQKLKNDLHLIWGSMAHYDMFFFSSVYLFATQLLSIYNQMYFCYLYNSNNCNNVKQTNIPVVFLKHVYISCWNIYTFIFTIYNWFGYSFAFLNIPFVFTKNSSARNSFIF